MVVVSKTHVRSRSRRGKYQLLIIILSSLACQFEQSALHYGLACIFTTYIYTWFSPTYSPQSDFLLLQFFTIVLYQKVHKIRSRYTLIAVFFTSTVFLGWVTHIHACVPSMYTLKNSHRKRKFIQFTEVRLLLLKTINSRRLESSSSILLVLYKHVCMPQSKFERIWQFPSFHTQSRFHLSEHKPNSSDER